MNPRRIAGSITAYLFNEGFGQIPSRTIRHAVLRTWLKHLGKGAGVQCRCRFLNGRKVSIGDHSVINFGCLLDGRKYEIVTGNHVSIGPEAALLTLGHDPHSPDFADRGGPVTVGDYAWIGYRAIILPGLTLGEGAVVGAGAVVTRDVEPWTIVAGNPAKPIGKREPTTYQLNFRPWLL